MADTKAQRREAWKQRATETATELRKAKATVTLSGKRSIPLSAISPEQIRVDAWQQANPDRYIVDYSGDYEKIIVNRGEPPKTPAQRQAALRVAEWRRQNPERIVVDYSKPYPSQNVNQPMTIISTDKYRRTSQLRAADIPFRYVPQPTKPLTITQRTALITEKASEQAKDTKYGKVEIGGKEISSQSFYKSAKKISESIQEAGKFSQQYYEQKSAFSNTIVGTALGKTAVVSTKAAGGVVEFVGMMPGGVETLARKPELIKPAIKVGAYSATVGTAKAFKEDPIQTSADMLAFMAIAGVGARMSPVKTGKIYVPESGKLTSYRTVYSDIAGHVKPIVGMKGFKPVKGTPKFNIDPGYVPATKLETASTLQSITSKMSKTEAKRFKAGLELLQTLKSEKPIDAKPISEVKYIPKNARSIVNKWIKKEGGQVYGSAVQRAQLGKGRIPADIDVAVGANPKLAAARLTQALKPILKDRVRRKGATVEIYENGGWHHGVDIHSKTSIEGLLGYGFESKPAVTIKGQKQMQIAEQYQRKGISALIPRGKRFGPEPHRVKDTRDFITISKVLIDNGFKTASQARILRNIKEQKYIKAAESLKVFTDKPATVKALRAPAKRAAPSQTRKPKGTIKTAPGKRTRKIKEERAKRPSRKETKSDYRYKSKPKSSPKARAYKPSKVSGKRTPSKLKTIPSKVPGKHTPYKGDIPQSKSKVVPSKPYSKRPPYKGYVPPSKVTPSKISSKRHPAKVKPVPATAATKKKYQPQKKTKDIKKKKRVYKLKNPIPTLKGFLS